ncbi:MAG: hypothetical protein ACJ72S_07365 [Nitrososphaeraceae archaeon]
MSSSPSSSASPSSTSQTIDNEKLQQFMGKILSDFGGAGGCVLVYIEISSDYTKPCLILESQLHHKSLLILPQLLNVT